MRHTLKSSRACVLFLVLSLFSFFSLSSLAASEDKSYASGKINFSVAPGWEEVPVTSSMRQFQFRIPKAQEDSEDGELAVFYFGPGQGGGVQANIERWQSQFKPSSGGLTAASELTVKDINGLKVTVTSLEGSYEGAMGAQAGTVKEGYALLGAIVEGPEGLVFFKLTGPSKTVQGARAQFDSLVQSFKV